MVSKLFVFALSWLPVVALAGPANLDRAGQLAAEMKYPQALKLVDKVLRSASSGPEAFAKAYAIQGQCLAATGKARKATGAFRRLLAIEPGYRLPEHVSPKFRPPFDKALKLAPKQGLLKLEHEPPADVSELGGTVLTVKLVANPLKMASAVRLVYFAGGAEQAKAVRPIKAKKRLTFRLPKKLSGAELRYYFEAVTRHKGVLARSTSADQPHVLEVARPAVAAADPASGDGGADEPVPTPLVDSPADGDGAADPGETVVRKPTSDLDGAAAAAGADPAAGAVAQGGGEDDSDGAGPAWYQTWWFWTGVGVVVAGGVATGLAVGLSDDGGGPIRYDVTLR